MGGGNATPLCLMIKATLKTTGKPPTTKRDGNAGDEGGNDLNSIRDVAKFEFKNSEILKGTFFVQVMILVPL